MAHALFEQTSSMAVDEIPHKIKSTIEFEKIFLVEHNKKPVMLATIAYSKPISGATTIRKGQEGTKHTTKN